MPTILQRYLGANIAEDIVKIYYNGEQVFPLDITVSPDTGALVFTAYVPSLDTTLNLDSSQVTFSGFAPSLDTAINTGFGAMSFTGYAPEIPTTTLLDGIVAYYNFDEASGNLLDQVGSADGTVTGATQNVTGKIGKAVSFDGVNDFVSINGLVTPLASTTEGTVSIWMKPTDSTPTGSEIIWAFGDTNANEYLSCTMVATTGRLQFVCRDAGTLQWVLLADSNPLSSGVWSLVTLVHNGTEASMYVDGSLVASTFTISTNKKRWFNDLTGLDNLRIGCGNYNSAGNIFFFNGDTDEMPIHNRALTADEITELYNSGTGKTHPFT